MTGCSSYAELIPFEQDDITVSGKQPLAKCIWPELNEGRIKDQDVVYMSADDFTKQAACQETEQANHDLAKENAEMVDGTVTAFNALVKKAKVHHQNAENELERVDDARQATNLEVWAYKVLLALTLIAVAL